MHPIIRNEEACFLSSSFAIRTWLKNAIHSLHILHISTGEELALFTNKVALGEKRITAEVCVHHLFFDADDYTKLGARIKWNPAVKDKRHKPELLQALLNGTLDVVATDHAPHTLEEKANLYSKCPGGAPMVQHSLMLMLDFYHKGQITVPQIAEKMSHNVATCFQIKDRGFIREGYFGDVFLLDADKPQLITANSLHYKCGWSPLEGYTFKGKIEKTFVNGNLVYDNDMFIEGTNGARLLFNR
jgi:dihydroorotase